MNRFGAGVNDPVIGRIHGHPANIAFQHSIPMPPGVSGAIETIKSYAGKNCLRTLLTSVNGIDDLFLEVRLEFPRASHGGPYVSDAAKNDHSRLRSRIQSIGFSHNCFLQVLIERLHRNYCETETQLNTMPPLTWINCPVI